MRCIEFLAGSFRIFLTAITLYQINCRTDKRNAARYTYITGHQIVKVQPVDGRIKEFLEYQYHHRTRIANEIQCNNEKAHIPFYLEASDEALEKECLETKVDCVERQALEKQPHHRRQPQSRIIESHET